MVTRISTARTRRCIENSQISGKRKPNGTGRGFLQGHTRGAITPAPFVQTTSGCRATVPRTQPPVALPPFSVGPASHSTPGHRDDARCTTAHGGTAICFPAREQQQGLNPVCLRTTVAVLGAFRLDPANLTFLSDRQSQGGSGFRPAGRAITEPAVVNDPPGSEK